ncbi:class I SAM-dependent methyltransferase [Propionivibrio sp.]|uniref:class I SAM-dependent methyltransferase n=1 Tax=Propionivibrio sp. TaxID=2212460 RepID=UPI0025FD3F7F|nr:class I SAM-dependent methyltransferase [Propionivibrio sp.]MBK7354685.1 class I SAM-dependent methyltransferase [Propionivibrio sp.]
MESVACDFCGSTESVQIARQTDLLHRTTDEFFDIVQCTSCGLQYTNPRPESAEIGRYYAKGYSFHAARSKLRRVIAAVSERVANGPLAALAGLLPGISRRLAMHVKPSITDPVRDYYASGGVGTMLDIGCGTGASAHFWGERGALLAYRQITEVAGVEVADRARELLAGEGVEAWRDIGDVPRDRRFGLIRMNWSLEHVYSPLRYFSFIRDRLETNGRAVITVPNYDGLIYRLAPDCVELPIHLYHFRPCDIENFADRCGLRVLELRTFSYSQMFIAAAQAGLFPGSFSKQLNVWQARTFQSVLTRFDRAGWGNDMIAVLGPVR